jgi:hypothetical protein
MLGADSWVQIGLFALSAIAICVSFWVKSTAKAEAEECVEEAKKELLDGKIPNAIDTKVERVANLLYERINNHETRVTRIESALADLPRSADLHKLQVAELVGEVKGVRNELHGQSDNFKRLEKQFDKVEEWAVEAAKDAKEAKDRKSS